MGQRLIDWPRSRAIEAGGSGLAWPRVDSETGRIEVAAVPHLHRMVSCRASASGGTLQLALRRRLRRARRGCRKNDWPRRFRRVRFSSQQSSMDKVHGLLQTHAAKPCNPCLRPQRRMLMVKVQLRACLALACLCGAAASAGADDLTCVSTTFRLIGKNDRVCVSAFDDPKVPGVACHVSQARTGGLSGTIGLAEDPSRFSIACRQVGPIHLDLATLTDREEVYSARTSIFFKRTHVYRVLDKTRNTLVYLAISDKLVDGSPQNAISTVPIMPWVTGR